MNLANVRFKSIKKECLLSQRCLSVVIACDSMDRVRDVCCSNYLLGV